MTFEELTPMLLDTNHDLFYKLFGFIPDKKANVYLSTFDTITYIAKDCETVISFPKALTYSDLPIGLVLDGHIIQGITPNHLKQGDYIGLIETLNHTDILYNIKAIGRIIWFDEQWINHIPFKHYLYRKAWEMYGMGG